jgi:hypothetical protein
MLGIVKGDLFLRSSRIHPTMLHQCERLSCMTCHGRVRVVCIRFLVSVSAPTNNRVYKIVCFQIRDGLMNEEHTNVSWFKHLRGGNSPTSSGLILMKTGVTKGEQSA